MIHRMRIAVFSDIHGNGLALEAVLADIQSKAPDRLVCLGDAIQGGPQPGQVVRRLREMQCPVVMGNADAWLLTGKETGDEAITSERLQAMNDVRLWTLAQLSDDDLAFMASFPPTVELALAVCRREKLMVAWVLTSTSFSRSRRPAKAYIGVLHVLAGCCFGL